MKRWTADPALVEKILSRTRLVVHV